MSLRALPGRGVRHRHRQPPPQEHFLTTTTTSYELKRRELVLAVQASLKELYAAGYTRSRATGAIVRLLQQQTRGSSSSVLAAPPDEADLVRVMRQHQMTDGSAKHLLAVSQWIMQRTQKHQNSSKRSRSKKMSTTSISSDPTQHEAAVLRAMDDLVRIVRDAPRSILTVLPPANPSVSVSRAPTKAAPVPASNADPTSGRVLTSPLTAAPDSGNQAKQSATIPRHRPSSALESIDELTSTEETKKPKLNPAPSSASAVARTKNAPDGSSSRRKSSRGAASDPSSSAALAAASPARARSDSDVEAERTVSSKVLSSHPRAAESSSSSAAAAASVTGGSTIASAASIRKRSRTSSSGGGGDPQPSPAPTVRSSAGPNGGGGKRTRTRR